MALCMRLCLNCARSADSRCVSFVLIAILAVLSNVGSMAKATTAETPALITAPSTNATWQYGPIGNAENDQASTSSADPSSADPGSPSDSEGFATTNTASPPLDTASITSTPVHLTSSMDSTGAGGPLPPQATSAIVTEGTSSVQATADGDTTDTAFLASTAGVVTAGFASTTARPSNRPQRGLIWLFAGLVVLFALGALLLCFLGCLACLKKQRQHPVASNAYTSSTATARAKSRAAHGHTHIYETIDPAQDLDAPELEFEPSSEAFMLQGQHAIYSTPHRRHASHEFIQPPVELYGMAQPYQAPLGGSMQTYVSSDHGSVYGSLAGSPGHASHWESHQQGERSSLYSVTPSLTNSSLSLNSWHQQTGYVPGPAPIPPQSHLTQTIQTPFRYAAEHAYAPPPVDAQVLPAHRRYPDEMYNPQDQANYAPSLHVLPHAHTPVRYRRVQRYPDSMALYDAQSAAQPVQPSDEWNTPWHQDTDLMHEPGPCETVSEPLHVAEPSYLPALHMDNISQGHDQADPEGSQLLAPMYVDSIPEEARVLSFVPPPRKATERLAAPPEAYLKRVHRNDGHTYSVEEQSII
ncbi:uncharacterized protein MONBRDRAFT_24520 [Monosiga brevicollis MX1]|uniref:Transmembrane protein n=1 Tax=Monosiga brevicollis TaxID=81824 RepID=A9UWN8_MONBE|nr:uncharacterized protein MONBRDRAFT_24520 [Monosiga brevicollis MX1]EDQ90077.1 predicted protein [Monosiga brevicollis MX1]|eukprot:XP_001744844.1 hypothetical protein [Monosiga brevicollis MX1]